MHFPINGGLCVARRSFKAGGKLYTVGTVIDRPEDIKFIRSRIGNRDVIILNEANKDYEGWISYLEARVEGGVLDPRVYALRKAEEPLSEERATIVESTKPPATPAKQVKAKSATANLLAKAKK